MFEVFGVCYLIGGVCSELFRVSNAIISDGHTVLVQKDAGLKAGFSNEEYEKKGAEIVEKLEEMYERSNLLAKVKEIEEVEYKLLRENQIIYTCIHLAAHEQQVQKASLSPDTFEERLAFFIA